MRDVIQKIIEAEAEAKRVVAAAQVEADRIAADAQKQGQDLVARARQEARLQAEKMLEVAAQDAGQEKQEQLSRVAVELETDIRLEEPTRQRVVEGVVRCVCGRR